MLDVADYPTSFSEAPDLAAKVAAGELPPVAERLPNREDLLVLDGGSIGTYGGSIVMSTLGSTEALNRNASAFDKFIFWDPTGGRLVPALAKAWEQSDDARSVTLHLREGLKWSDGHPLTTEDVRYWYEDVYRNTEIQPEPEPVLTPNGVPATLVIIDDYTLRWEFEEPYWTFPEQLACPFCPIGRGFTLAWWLPGGPVVPAHYMKQFHPKYAGQDAVDKMAADAELESWVSLYGNKMNWGLNPELPVITPYKTVEGSVNASALWKVERNPYFWAVDSAGNQLPYIDTWELPKVETPDMVYLRLAGRQDDFNWRLPKLDQVPFMLENKDRGNYDVYFDYANAGSASMIYVNRTWRGDPEIEALLNAADFRRAVSLGIDREQYNEAWMLGLAVPGSPVVADHHPMNPGPEYRTLWHTYEPDRANELLDGLGLTERDSDGFRLTPGGNRVTISLAVVQSHPDWVGQTEIFVEEMKELDLDIKLDVLADEMSGQWRATNQYQLSWGANWGSEDFWGGGAPAAGLPVDQHRHQRPALGRLLRDPWREGRGAGSRDRGRRPEGVGALRQGPRSPGRGALRARQGDLEDPDRRGLDDRHRRAGVVPPARAQQPVGQRGRKLVRGRQVPLSRLLPPGAVVLGIAQGNVAIDRLAPGRAAPAPAFSTCRE